MRKSNYKKRRLAPDQKYNSLLVSQLVNYVMRCGKKAVAQRIVYRAMDELEKREKKDALEILQTAVKNAAPVMEVKSKRVGGATYQVPFEVRPSRKIALSLRWILSASRSRQGKSFDKILAEEMHNAYKNIGAAITKKENMHKAAQANKAFAHFARF